MILTTSCHLLLQPEPGSEPNPGTKPNPNPNPEPSPDDDSETNIEPSNKPTQTKDDSKSSFQPSFSPGITSNHPLFTSTRASSTATSSLSNTLTEYSSGVTSSPLNTSTQYYPTGIASASCAKTITTSACGALCVPTSCVSDTSAVQSCSTFCFSTVLCSGAATTSTRTQTASCPLATFTTVSTPPWLAATWSVEEMLLKEVTSLSVNAYSSSNFAAQSSPTGSNSGGGSGNYGGAVIPAPGADAVIPPMNSGRVVTPKSRADAVVPPMTSGLAVTSTPGANVLPLTVVPPLTSCTLVRWVFHKCR